MQIIGTNTTYYILVKKDFAHNAIHYDKSK